MTRDEIKNLSRRWMQFWQGGSLEQFEAMHAVDFIDHSATQRAPDRESFRLSVFALYEAFPDFSASIDSVNIDEFSQCAAIRWCATGRHEGRFLGVDATQRNCSFTGIELIRVRDGVVMERWGEWDGLAIERQIRCG